MFNLRLNKRGVSPIIATLLLVAIAVAASVITYTWAMSMTSNQAQKSQTDIQVDRVLFGQVSSTHTTVAQETTAASSTVGSVIVDPAATNFAVGDYIKVTSAGGTVLGVTKVTAVTLNTPSTDSTLTVVPDLSSAPAAGATVSLVAKVNGVLISMRNAGTIATSIQTVYIFRGDALIATADFTSSGVSNTMSTGAQNDIAVTPFHSITTSWSQLKAGGASLPAPSTGYLARTDFAENLAINTPYFIRIVTNTGFTAQGTYYTPGSFT